MADENLTPSEASGEGTEEQSTPSTPSNRPKIKKRRSRKERQEDLGQPDEFMEVGGTIVDWMVERGKPILSLLCVVLVGLLTYGLMQKSDTGRREDASALLSEGKRLLPSVSSGGGAKLSLSTGDSLEDQKAKTEEALAKFDEVLSGFEGSAQAVQAALQAANSLMAVSEHDRALAYFQKIENGSGLSAQLGQAGQAAALVNLGRFDEAVVVLEALTLAQKGTTTLVEQTLLDLGRALELAGKVDQAKALYGSYEIDYPDSALLTDVRARAADLGSN